MQHVIELFVADHCPGYPDARLRVREFAENRRNVVVVDGRAVLYGVPTTAQLAARCGQPMPATV